MEKPTTKYIQNIVYDIFVNFDNLCKKNNIRYYLAYGTLLGAVRHNGFIPWDDDLDVWMTREEYEKLIQVTKCTMKAQYRLHNELKIGDFSLCFQGKYVNTNIKVEREKFGEKVVVYPWIDIFILDSCPKKHIKLFKNKVKFFAIIYNLYRLRNNEPSKNRAKGLRRVLFKINDIIPFFCLFKNSEKWLFNSLTKYKCGDYYFSLASEYMNDLNKCTFSKKWFSRPKKIKFENGLFCVPEKYDNVLQNIYGDYMKLPPVEDRVRKHGISKVKYLEEQ